LLETNAAETQRSGGLSFFGMQIGGGATTDSIVIDVRIVDARNGDVVDAIWARKSIKADSVNESGVGALIDNALAQKGKSTPYTPDVNVQQQRREGVDFAMRAAINEAVFELAKRFGR
jgi:curli biogenesis system outer membrane secretion channel CsgG